MDNAIKEKAIDGVLEYLVDKRFVCGEVDTPEFRLYAKDVLVHSDLFVDASPDEIQVYVGYTNTPVETRREVLKKEKFIEGYVECLCDTRFVCGKTDGAEFRFYMKEVLSNSGLIDYVSPDEVQSYIGYVNIPVEHRRELISESIKNNAELIMDMTLPLFFKGLSCIVSGEFTLAEMNEQFKQLCPPELCDMALKKLTKELGLDEVFKLEPRDLGLLPRNVGGANERLRTVLDQRSVRQNDSGSDYEQDLAVALWDSSEGKDLGKSTKMLDGEQCPGEIMATVREKARSTVLRILRETFEDMPEIKEKINEAQRQEEYEKKNNLEKLDFALRSQPKFKGDSPFKKEVHVNAMSLESLPDNKDSAQVELSEEEAREVIVEAFDHKGIKYDDLTPKEWAEIFERRDLIEKGYEFSSKIGMSIGSFYGDKANSKEKQWSRVNQKVSKLVTKPK
jgi:hypothetical protein